MTPTATTRLAAVIGSPVRHSLSPAIHNAAFTATGLDWVFVAFEVAPGDAPAAVAALDVLGIEGLSVTMPHKTAVAAALEYCTASATALRAVNCVFRDGDRLVGDNTDGGGFVDSLRAEGIDPSGMDCVVVGAGGAARAVVRALVDEGVGRIGVVNRDRARAEAAAALGGSLGAVVDHGALAHADLVVNATPVGMGDDPSTPFDPDMLRSDAVVADLVYDPITTPLLAAAASSGSRTVGGLGMLVHQAARAFVRWTGTEAPIAAMTDAVRDRLD